ncbi:hypothetical protein C0J52_04218 [Blattella germanica]|nr:hypothetical protein C0J52_04218 [Blattella germanica]
MNPMEITLDPKEVKMYLHRLGYCHITAEQLKDFIKDDCSNRLGAPLLSDVPDSGFRRSKQCKIQKEPLKTRSIENIQQPVRPKSSFIKPWNINCGLPPGTVKRSDPVLLYKQYQDIWKQQKVPGENNHSNLRWCIREHMLGTDPHPRPISQASSIGSRGHRKV